MRQRTKNRLDAAAYIGTVLAIVGFLFWFFLAVSA